MDWHKDPITAKTIITKDYRNTQNVRRFFKAQIGEHFHFTVEFMQWMKENTGKTLGDAVNEWQRLYGG